MTVFISHKLAHNHADEAAIWSRMMVLHDDVLLDFLEQRLDISSTVIPLESLSFPCKA